MGFAVPIANWLNNHLKDYVEQFINKDKIKSQGIFKWDFIAKLKSDFTVGKEYDTKLWYFLMFQMWYEKWMRN